MKSNTIIGLAMVMVMAVAGAASASNITSTKHNLSTSGTGDIKSTTTSEICVFCHTPHNATQKVPLWNRDSITLTGFQLYSSGSMQNGGNHDGAMTVDSISLFCLSCHDGTASLGSAVHNKPADSKSSITMTGANVDASGNLKNTSTAYLGRDLRDDHPVNFNVVSGLDPDIGAVTGSTMKTGAVSNGFPLFKTGRGDTTLECGSCHAVHDNTNVPFLRTTMAGSMLCLGCHKK